MKLSKYTLEFSVVGLSIVAFFLNAPLWTYLLFIGLGTALSIWRQQKISTELIQFLSAIEKLKHSTAGTTEQINGSCQSLEESSSIQTSAIIQSSSASDQISAMLERSSSNINQVKNSSDEINKIISVSSKHADQLEFCFNESIKNNEQVNHMLTNSVQLLQNLGTLFDEVASKTGVINDIVFQTKLLSFNASVEAARAGEHGRGFAVVAEEIGKLAEMSGTSAHAIRQTLDKTESEVGKIVSDIKTMSESLGGQIKVQHERASEIMCDFKSSFEKAQSGTREITSEIHSLVEAAEEQSRGINDLRNATHEVNETIKKNTLVVSQTLKLTNLLTEEMVTLEDLIKKAALSNKVKIFNQVEEIPWDNKYCIGVDEMDRQHIQLLDGINHLIRQMNLADYSKIDQSFSSLYEVVNQHFSEEEALLQKVRYPSYESHKKVHENLLAKLRSFQAPIENRQLDFHILASFLRNWLFTHIMGIDTKYAEHIHEADLEKNHHFRKVA